MGDGKKAWADDLEEKKEARYKEESWEIIDEHGPDVIRKYIGNMIYTLEKTQQTQDVFRRIEDVKKMLRL
jgi:flagellar biosynthesis component FlhA